MSKKIIAILTIVTVLFVCVFAACEKDDSIYIDDKEYDFVTDENGERVLDDEGRFLIYSKDENGKYVTDASGEKVTEKKPFEFMENDGVVEAYGYKLTLPEGWSVTQSADKFENVEKGQTVEIAAVKEAIGSYTSKAYLLYEEAQKQDIDSSWKTDIELGEGFENAKRLTISQDGKIVIVYIFENSGNTYKIVFNATSKDGALKDSKEFCKGIEFKPYKYYDDIPTTTEKK